MTHVKLKKYCTSLRQETLVKSFNLPLLLYIMHPFGVLRYLFGNWYLWFISLIIHLIKFQEESVKFSNIIPNYEQTIEKLLTLCCRLSREAWIVHTTSTKGLCQFKQEFSVILKMCKRNHFQGIPSKNGRICWMKSQTRNTWSLNVTASTENSIQIHRILKRM